MLDSVRQNDSTAPRVSLAGQTFQCYYHNLDCALYSTRFVEGLGSYNKNYALHAMLQQCIKFIAACEGSPHNVLHSSSSEEVGHVIELLVNAHS